MRKRTEGLAYISLLGLLFISMSGIPHMRYAFYGAPVVTLLLWILNDQPKVRVDRSLLPFALLFIVGLVSLVNYDFNTLKKTFFIFVYGWIFFLFDFSQLKIDFRKLAAFFIAVFLIRLVLVNGLSPRTFEFSVLDSKSSLESTLAFPLGFITLYFFLTKRYLWFSLMSFISLLALKRVVLIALMVSILINFIPQRLRKYILNPFTVSAGLLFAVLIFIEFAHGRFDSKIMEYTGFAANHFSKGRQQLWSSALTAAAFKPADFIFGGIGVGKVVTELQHTYHLDRILLHNDLLTIVLESGFLFFLVFIFLLNWQASHRQRTASLFLSVLLMTDNVIIYQHVMFVYLLIQTSLERQEEQQDPEITYGPNPTDYA